MSANQDKCNPGCKLWECCPVAYAARPYEKCELSVKVDKLINAIEEINNAHPMDFDGDYVAMAAKLQVMAFAALKDFKE